MSEIVGTVLQGRYRITEEMARGGMGAVYKAERLKLGRMVAVKFLLGWTDDREARKRFELEAMAMGRLHHPNCVTVTDFGLHEGVPYLVMELVVGEPLDFILDEGPLEPERAIAIARKILAGLGHAHEQGIVHRDIKPANIMVHATPGFDDDVRILDFGVAKLQADSRDLTAGMAIGTPSYMAPEQGMGEPVDGRSDIYSVGALLFVMITGDKPFQHDNPLELLRLHREQPRPPVPGVSPELERVIHTAMAPAKADRYQTAAEMVAVEAKPTPRTEGFFLRRPARPAAPHTGSPA